MKEHVPTALESEKSNIVFDVAQPEDAEGIVDVRYQTWLTTYPKYFSKDEHAEGLTKEDIQRKFSDLPAIIARTKDRLKHPEAGKRVFVARSGDRIVGFSISLQANNGVAEVNALYVLDDLQGQGVGRKLLHQALEWVDAEHQDVRLEVMKHNIPARKFYEANGFGVSIEDMQRNPNLSDDIYMPHTEMLRPAGPLG